MINTGLFFRRDSGGGGGGGNCIIIFFPRKVSSFEHRINLLHIISCGMSGFFADWAISDKASVEE